MTGPHERDRADALGIRRITPLADGDAAEREVIAKANAERMRKLNADPAFAKGHAERMRKLNADPAFAKARASAVSAAQKKRWAQWRRDRASEGR